MRFAEIENLFSGLKKPAVYSYLQPGESSPHFHKLRPQGHLIIRLIVSSKPATDKSNIEAADFTKRLYPSANIHGITFQKKIKFIITARNI
jgi:hypothetical protein